MQPFVGHLAIFDIDADVARGRVQPYSKTDLDELVAEGYARCEKLWHNRILNFGISAVSRLIGFGRGVNPSLANDLTGVIGGITLKPLSSVNDLKIDVMGFGNNPVPDADTSWGNNMTNSDSIYNATDTNGNLTVSYPDFFSVQFEGLIPSGAIAATEITETALFMSALPNDLANQEEGTLFARALFDTPILYTGAAKQVNHTLGPFTAS